MAPLFSGFQGKVKMAPLDLKLCVGFDSCEDHPLTQSQPTGVINGWPGVKNASPLQIKSVELNSNAELHEPKLVELGSA